MSIIKVVPYEDYKRVLSNFQALEDKFNQLAASIKTDCNPQAIYELKFKIEALEQRVALQSTKLQSQQNQIKCLIAKKESISNHGAMWTTKDETFLADQLSQMSEELASQLGRTPYAVLCRMKKLVKEGALI